VNPIGRVVTHGTFELDGGSWEVDNNVWIVGDGSAVVVFDAAHSAAPIVTAVAGRHVVAVVGTHAHNDHVTVAPELGDTLDAPVLLHPADDVLWRMTHPDRDFRAISGNESLRVGGLELRALHTPGHSPGSVCWYAPDLGAVFSGDTLFAGGPGATGRCSRSRRSWAGCPATPSCTPVTATPPPWGTRSRTTTTGWPEATDGPGENASARPGSGVSRR
jgi:glyoxylase-like metal-dependent hydrolase (beta-lactamase superfamily II)